MMLFRKNDAALDFDLAKVIEQSKDNAVFYVQYGHARGHSTFRNARANPSFGPAGIGGRPGRHPATPRWSGSAIPLSSTSEAACAFFPNNRIGGGGT